MEENFEKKEFLNLKEAGKLLGISRQMVSKLSYLKDFPCTRLKRRVLINRVELLKWMEENKSLKKY